MTLLAYSAPEVTMRSPGTKGITENVMSQTRVTFSTTAISSRYAPASAVSAP